MLGGLGCGGGSRTGGEGVGWLDTGRGMGDSLSGVEILVQQVW